MLSGCSDSGKSDPIEENNESVISLLKSRTWTWSTSDISIGSTFVDKDIQIDKYYFLDHGQGLLKERLSTFDYLESQYYSTTSVYLFRYSVRGNKVIVKMVDGYTAELIVTEKMLKSEGSEEDAFKYIGADYTQDDYDFLQQHSNMIVTPEDNNNSNKLQDVKVKVIYDEEDYIFDIKVESDLDNAEFFVRAGFTKDNEFWDYKLTEGNNALYTGRISLFCDSRQFGDDFYYYNRVKTALENKMAEGGALTGAEKRLYKECKTELQNLECEAIQQFEAKIYAQINGVKYAFREFDAPSSSGNVKTDQINEKLK